MLVGSLMIAIQVVCAAYGTITRSVYNYSGPRVRRPYHSAYHTYLGIFGI